MINLMIVIINKPSVNYNPITKKLNDYIRTSFCSNGNTKLFGTRKRLQNHLSSQQHGIPLKPGAMDDK